MLEAASFLGIPISQLFAYNAAICDTLPKSILPWVIQARENRTAELCRKGLKQKGGKRHKQDEEQQPSSQDAEQPHRKRKLQHSLDDQTEIADSQNDEWKM